MIRINGAPVIELDMHLPLNGAWSADLHCAQDQEFALGSVVTLSLPEQDFVCRIVNSKIYAERVHLRVIGGTVDWQLPVTAVNYAKVSSDQVLSSLSVSTDQPIGKTLNFWSRSIGTVGSSVQQLSNNLGTNWRINPDGTVRIRAEDPQLVDPDAVETWRDESRGMIELAVEKATIFPGCLVGSDSVGDVSYQLRPEGRLCCRYWTQGKGRSLERYVQWVTRDTLYHGMYTAKVIRQAGDGTLDLTPEDERIRGTGFQGVEIRHGLPGCSVKVAPGERVLLGFDRGDPSAPYAALWASGSVLEIQLGGALPVAISQKVDAAVAAIIAAFNAHTHVAPPGGGVTAPPVPQATPQASTASLILKSS